MASSLSVKVQLAGFTLLAVDLDLGLFACAAEPKARAAFFRAVDALQPGASCPAGAVVEPGDAAALILTRVRKVFDAVAKQPHALAGSLFAPRAEPAATPAPPEPRPDPVCGAMLPASEWRPGDVLRLLSGELVRVAAVRRQGPLTLEVDRSRAPDGAMETVFCSRNVANRFVVAGVTLREWDAAIAAGNTDAMVAEKVAAYLRAGGQQSEDIAELTR